MSLSSQSFVVEGEEAMVSFGERGLLASGLVELIERVRFLLNPELKNSNKEQ